MKTQLHIIRPNKSNHASEFVHAPPGKLGRKMAVLGAAAGVLLAAQTAPAFPFPEHRVGDIFVIALENHNFTQPTNMTSPQQILGNPAAPYLNSLITPGNSNAVQVSYATAYYNAAIHDHPSEPNYVWAEAGTDFGAHTDADPREANGNTFYDQSIHFTRLLNEAGIPWKDYQEDIEYSVSPTNSAYGTNAPVPNPYNGSDQYGYAVKHNPSAFFADTATENVYPLSQFFLDLANGAVGRYNWITPDVYNEAHSSLNGGFMYHGIHYTGDQSAIAAADHFLSIVIPRIMATPEYQDNGVIVLWWDEAEGGDDTNHAIPEIIISPLAKGNAYASSVPLNHSSDIKTWSEIFHLPFVSNPIPTNETDVTGIGYNNVATVNDLSDLFVPGTIPAAPQFSVTTSRLIMDPYTHHAYQFAFIKNTSFTPAPAPLWLVLDNLSGNATLLDAAGTTSIIAPLGSPYVSVTAGDGDGGHDEVLYPFQTRRVLLEFNDPAGGDINYATRVLDVTPAP